VIRKLKAVTTLTECTGAFHQHAAGLCRHTRWRMLDQRPCWGDANVREMIKHTSLIS